MNTLLPLVLIPALILTAPALAGDPPATAKPAAADAEQNLTDATSEGAMKLFIKAMSKGDWARVVELSDPGSADYQQVQDMSTALENPDLKGPQREFVVELFARPWRDLEVKQVTEQGTRARYNLTYFLTDPNTKERVETSQRNVDLNQIDGKWRVIVTTELLTPAKPEGAPPVPETATPAPVPAPAPAPAPAEKPK